jgi:hypothetical protein
MEAPAVTPKLRQKKNKPARFAPPTDIVYAISDVMRGSRYVRRGEPLQRDDEMVRELPSEFEVRYRLDLEGDV